MLESPKVPHLPDDWYGWQIAETSSACWRIQHSAQIGLDLVQAKLTKASFLADLRGQMQPSQASATNPKVVPTSRPAPALTAAAAEAADDDDTAEPSHDQEPVVAARPGPLGRQAALQQQQQKLEALGTKARDWKTRRGTVAPQEAVNEPAWAVLQAGFSGLQGELLASKLSLHQGH